MELVVDADYNEENYGGSEDKENEGEDLDDESGLQQVGQERCEEMIDELQLQQFLLLELSLFSFRRDEQLTRETPTTMA